MATTIHERLYGRLHANKLRPGKDIYKLDQAPECPQRGSAASASTRGPLLCTMGRRRTLIPLICADKSSGAGADRTWSV